MGFVEDELTAERVSRWQHAEVLKPLIRELESGIRSFEVHGKLVTLIYIYLDDLRHGNAPMHRD